MSDAPARMTPLLGVADAAIIGRLGQAHLLAAIAAAAMIFNFLFWSFGFLRMGTAGLVAQALGADDVTEQRAALLRALMVAGSPQRKKKPRYAALLPVS